MERKATVSELEPGGYFDDSLPCDAPSRDRVYRVVAVRTRTVLAENVLGLRRSFNRSHEVAPASKELWDRLAATPAPATPVVRPEAGEERTVVG